MGPVALEAYASGHNFLSTAQHYFLSSKLFNDAKALILPEVKENSYTADLRLPSERMFFEFPTHGAYLRVHGETAEGWIAINGEMRRATVFKHGETGFFRPKPYQPFSVFQEMGVGDTADAAFLTICLSIAHLLSEPRLVVQSPPARAFRKRAQALLGSDVPAVWRQLSWTIGKPVKTAAKGEETGERRPLHYCVAHWMRAEEHWPTAERRADSDGWWCWRKASWRGHPDFGIAVQRRRPLLPDAPVERLPAVDRELSALAARDAAAHAVEAWKAQHAANGRAVTFSGRIV